MNYNGWRYYNHAYVVTTPPHFDVDEASTDFNILWKENKKALLARWTSNFDCGYETNWWYIIKDNAFDINSVKAKRRYEINKGIKNFEFKAIEPEKYAEDIYEVTVAAYSAYPSKYRPSLNKEAFLNEVYNWKGIVYAVFDRNDDKMGAYAIVNPNKSCLNLSVLKSIPSMKRLGVNAALVYGILIDLTEELDGRYYVCDGERSILHETAFQDYLQKYFGFRKAYCKLNIKYRPLISIFVRILYPFRNLIKKLTKINLINQITAIMKMEEIVRKQKHE